MSPLLPSFRYHPDPVASGSVEATTVACVSCGKPRSHVYVGPVYAAGDFSGKFCPWCIADGSAASKFDADFTDVGTDVPAEIAESVLDQVAHRTPGFQS